MKPEYRPCTITYKAKKGDAERTYNGWFHGWVTHAQVRDAIMVGHTGGQICCTLGLVELDNGTMREVRPELIRFNAPPGSKIRPKEM